MAPVAQSVTAADFVRRFGVWRERASLTPVTITNHGRGTHVLVSRDIFEASQAAGGTVGHGGRDPVDSSLVALFDRMRESALIVDSDLTVRCANPAACDLFKLGRSEIVGAPLGRTMPHLRESFLLRNIQRTLINGEHSATEIPSMTRADVWLHVETFPVEVGCAVFLRNITEEVQAHRSADVKQAIIRAMEVDGTVGYVRLSPREMVERVDSVLIDMIGLTEEALQRVRFSTVILSRLRGEFHQHFEAIFRGQGPVKFDTALLTADGREMRVKMSLVELRGAYATEGAVALVNKAD